MALPYENVIGDGFPGVFQQRFALNSRNDQIVRENMARAQQAEEAQNRWATLAAAARQRSDELGMSAEQNAAQMAQNERLRSAALGAEDRRTAAEREAAWARLRQDANKETSGIDAKGSGFAMQYNQARKSLDAAQAQLDAFKSTQQEAQQHLDHLDSLNDPPPLASTWKLAYKKQFDAATKSVTAAQKEYDKVSSAHDKLEDRMATQGFVADPERGTILHEPTAKKWSFKALKNEAMVQPQAVQPRAAVWPGVQTQATQATANNQLFRDRTTGKYYRYVNGQLVEQPPPAAAMPSGGLPGSQFFHGIPGMQ